MRCLGIIGHTKLGVSYTNPSNPSFEETTIIRRVNHHSKNPPSHNENQDKGTRSLVSSTTPLFNRRTIQQEDYSTGVEHTLTPDETQEYNNNIPVAPLRGFDNLTVDEWFARGLLNFPPIKGDFMELPSGGRYTAELACNRAWTTMRDPRMKDEPLETYACPVSRVGSFSLNLYGC